MAHHARQNGNSLLVQQEEIYASDHFHRVADFVVWFRCGRNGRRLPRMPQIAGASQRLDYSRQVLQANQSTQARNLVLLGRVLHQRVRLLPSLKLKLPRGVGAKLLFLGSAFPAARRFRCSNAAPPPVAEGVSVFLGSDTFPLLQETIPSP